LSKIEATETLVKEQFKNYLKVTSPTTKIIRTDQVARKKVDKNIIVEIVHELKKQPIVLKTEATACFPQVELYVCVVTVYCVTDMSMFNL
jgi:hypothetical protein